MKKLLFLLCLISLLFACESPSGYSTDGAITIPPIAMLPDNGTGDGNPDNGTGDGNNEEKPEEPPIGIPEHPDREPIFERPTDPEHPDREPIIERPTEPGHPDNNLPINIENRPDNILPVPIRDPNDPWQNLQIGYFTKDAVGLKRYEEFATDDLTGFGFTKDMNDNIEVLGYYYENNRGDSALTYQTYRDRYDADGNNLWVLQSRDPLGYSMIPNYRTRFNSFKESFYYERAEYNGTSRKFISNLPVGKTSIVVNYRPDTTKSFIYLFKETNQGYGKLELVGYKIYNSSNGDSLIEGDTEIRTPYIKSDYDPRS